MATDYYSTKLSRDEWIVHGRRHHIQIDRIEAPTGRADEYGEDILRDVYHVHDSSGLIDTSDQHDTDAHGFTRLKDALKYAIGKLTEYDNHVDPKKNPGDSATMPKRKMYRKRGSRPSGAGKSSGPWYVLEVRERRGDPWSVRMVHKDPNLLDRLAKKAVASTWSGGGGYYEARVDLE